MIIKDVFYGVKCDRCGTQYEDGESSYWYDESVAIENSMEDEWIECNQKHYCPNCHELDDEGGFIIYEEYPKYLKTLISFIDHVMTASCRSVSETETEFVVSFRFYKYGQSQLEALEEMYIKSLLGERLVSVGYSKSTLCTIIIKKTEKTI